MRTSQSRHHCLHDFVTAAVLIPGSINWVRDWVWTFFSYDLLSTRLKPTQDANFDSTSQWAGQQLYSTLAMFFALVCMDIFYRIKKPKNQQGEIQSFPWADGWIYLAGAAVAIYGWDRMQVVGIKVGQDNLKLSPTQAAYFAALFTGLEGCMQYVTIVGLRTFTMSKYYSAYKENRQLFLKQFFAGLFCSLTFVLSPGACWQTVFTTGVLKNWGAIATSFAVATGVAFFNYTSVKASILFLSYLHRACINRVDIPDAISVRSEIDSDSDDEAATLIHVVDELNATQAPLPDIHLTTEKLNLRDDVIDVHSEDGSSKSTSNDQQNKKALPVDYMPASADNPTEQSPLTRAGSSALHLGKKLSGSAVGFSKNISGKWSNLREKISAGELKNLTQ